MNNSEGRARKRKEKAPERERVRAMNFILAELDGTRVTSGLFSIVFN